MRLKIFKNKTHRHWQYKNTTILITVLVVFFTVFQLPPAQDFLHRLAQFGYPGGFVAGFFYASTFTVAPALFVLHVFNDTLPTVPLSLVAGFGSACGDFILLSLLRDRIFSEFKPLFGRLERGYVQKAFHSPYFFWLAPILGAIIIASPFPDELGIGILGISKIKKHWFFLLAFLLNSTGIFIILEAINILS